MCWLLLTDWMLWLVILLTVILFERLFNVVLVLEFLGGDCCRAKVFCCRPL